MVMITRTRSSCLADQIRPTPQQYRPSYMECRELALRLSTLRKISRDFPMGRVVGRSPGSLL